MSDTLVSLKTCIYFIALCLLASDAAAQCKYALNEIDPLTEQPVFRTKSQRISDGIKVKDGISFGFMDVELVRSTKGNSIKFDGHIKNPQGRSLMFMMPGDSLVMKFADRTIITVPPANMPSQYSNAINGKAMITFEFVLTDELMDKFRQGGTVTFIRISNDKQNWDMDEFRSDLGEFFRRCWL